MATMIVATAIGVKDLHIPLDRIPLGRFQAWRKRQGSGMPPAEGSVLNRQARSRRVVW